MVKFEPFFIVADNLPKVQVEELKVEAPSAKQGRLSSSAYPVPSVLQSVFNKGRLSIVCDFVGRRGFGVQFATN